MDSKSILTSKTFWVNLLALVAMILANFGFDLGIDDASKGEIAVGAIAIVNIVLRKLSNQPVHIVTPKIGAPKLGDGGNVSIRAAAVLFTVAVWGLMLQAIGWEVGAGIMAVIGVVFVLYGLSRRLLAKDFPVIGDAGTMRHRPAIALAAIAVVALMLTGCAGAQTKVDETLQNQNVQTGIQLACATFTGVAAGWDVYAADHKVGDDATKAVVAAKAAVGSICTAPYPNDTASLIASVTQAGVAVMAALQDAERVESGS